jgi:hypothetical protein
MRTFRVAVLLFISPVVMAQQFNMPKQQWLANLKPIMSQGFCNGAGSPFKQIYKGAAESCIPEVEKLFDFCVTSEPSVVLPDVLVSLPQANWFGQVMGECISAHYQGGAALEAFRALQRATTPPKAADRQPTNQQ